MRPGTAGASPTRVRSFTPTVLVVGIAVAALVVVALVVALAFPSRASVYAPGTPEAAFQTFYAAWEDRDLDAAYALLSADVRSSIDPAEYRRMDNEMTWLRDQNRRVVLLSSDITGDRTELRVRIEEFSSGGLGGERYTHEQTIPMVREDGSWFVDQGLLGVEMVFSAKY